MIDKNELKIIENEFKKVGIPKVSFVKDIPGGMSNKTYLFKDIDNLFVVHYSSNDALQFVDRNHERISLNILKKSPLIQEVVSVSSDYVRIFKYVDGFPLSIVDEKEKYLKSVSETLHNIHSHNFGFSYSPFEYLEKLEKLLKQKPSDYYFKIKSIIYEKKNFLLSRPLCACHNDYQPSNIIISNDKAILLDFEFAGDNDFTYDIATFGNINFKDSLSLLEIYKKDYSKDDLLALYLWRSFINIQWYLVALIKDEMGFSETLKLDFVKIADMFINMTTDLLVEINKLN